MSKAPLRCLAFKPVCRGSLRGFASIEFTDLKMTVHAVSIHAHASGAAWASPPAQAIAKNGVAVKDDRGKIQYSPPLLEFTSAEIRRAWSDRVVEEVLKLDPCALEYRGELQHEQSMSHRNHGICEERRAAIEAHRAGA